MVSATGIAIALLAASGAGGQADEKVFLSVWAVQATNEERESRHFDPGLETIRDAVADLPFDTYRRVRADRKEAACGAEIRFPLDARYTLFVKPVSREDDGRIRLDIRVEIAPRKEGDKPVNALSTRMIAAPGKKTRLGGFKLDKGELLIVLAAGN